MSRAEATAFLRQAPVFSLCGVLEDGQPVLRTLHGVVVDDLLCFHSSPKGEKTSLLGRPVVASAEEEVARIPSWFLDPERACPATTLYRSVQVHGELREVADPSQKARALQALMEKLQPGGGYVPITAADPRYAAQVKGLLVAGVSLERLDGKAKLAQNRSPRERTRLAQELWRRGAPGDARAIELLRAANPSLELPPFLAAPAGFSVHPWLPASRVEEAVELLAGEYWNDVFTRDELERAHLGATAWVGATDGQGRLVATARAIADGAKHAWVYDVAVAAPARRGGLGQAVMRLLLDHPAVRGCRRVLLGTRDAQSLYARFGFVPRAAAPPRPYPTTEMVLIR